MEKQNVSIFWFRRDLRLEDNHGLCQALEGRFPILPVFIFDENITNELPENDPRITFIYDRLQKLSETLNTYSSALYCKKGTPEQVWTDLIEHFNIQEVHTNEDYEPYATKRDAIIATRLREHHINFKTYKDQVIFAKHDVLKHDNTPYTVFTPYKNKWISKLEDNALNLRRYNIRPSNFVNTHIPFPALEALGFKRASVKVRDYRLDTLKHYAQERNFPGLDKTSYLSPHLRFGTVSIRDVVKKTMLNTTFLSELIWREFFMQIIYHFPEVVHANFKRKYDNVQWRNNTVEFERWKKGKTGYPLVDAGMRELNTTGYMHNRVRMVVASFLCKHLLIDWRWGEAYFAKTLLDYELSSNNGNWQWVAGTGCDAAPYFRIFNPYEQAKKFDPKLKYIKKWIPELETLNYPAPMVEHKQARLRAIETYKKGLQEKE